jgi:hypothetical protein
MRAGGPEPTWCVKMTQSKLWGNKLVRRPLKSGKNTGKYRQVQPNIAKYRQNRENDFFTDSRPAGGKTPAIRATDDICGNFKMRTTDGANFTHKPPVKPQSNSVKPVKPT